MNFQNTPVYSIMPMVPPDVYPYMMAVLGTFAVFFFVSLHWIIHVMQHGFPPLYVLRLISWYKAIRRAIEPSR